MSVAPPRPLTFALLRRMSDGHFHSGEALAHEFGVTRASVHNALADSGPLGIRMERVRGRGYRLENPPQFIDADRLRRTLGPLADHYAIEVLDQAASSNTLLMQRAADGAPSGSVLVVEWQNAGRGRLGRRWVSGLGDALTFSLLWRCPCGLSSLSGLSLAVGLAVVHALHAVGAKEVGLKWPNDILTPRGKLAGILIEAQGEMQGPCAAVIGIGLNLALPEQARAAIDQPCDDLAGLLGGPVDGTQLLAAILRELAITLDVFATHGFAALQSDWEHLHIAQHRMVTLNLPDGSTLSGVARGVTAAGALRLETLTGEREMHSGEINGLRHAHAAD